MVSGFELQVALYRNYSSPKEKLFEYTPFSSTAAPLVDFLNKAAVSGGICQEAVEVFYDHILNKEKDVSEIIIIGDAPCNPQSKIASYERSYTHVKVCHPDALVAQLISRKIKAHSFYIGTWPAAYFEDISNKTGGQAKQYDYSAPNAAKELTDFIVSKILKGIGGAGQGDKLVSAYKMRFP